MYHRVLKLENILLMGSSRDSLVKITDFDISKQFSSVEVLETFVGTPVFMAPEIFAMTGSLFDKQSCTCKSECWYDPWVLSSTCCSVALSPLRDHDADALKLKIMKLKGQYQPMIGWRWEAISEEDAEKLESKLLLVDPITLSQG